METKTDALVEDQRQRAIPTDTFRARLMLARMHAGDLTIREAAERAGLNHASWANWERGMKPRDILDVVDQVSEALGVDRDWLLYGGQLAAEVRRRDRHGRRVPAGRINEGSARPTGRPRSNRLKVRHDVSWKASSERFEPVKSAGSAPSRTRPAWTCGGAVT